MLSVDVFSGALAVTAFLAVAPTGLAGSVRAGDLLNIRDEVSHSMAASFSELGCFKDSSSSRMFQTMTRNGSVQKRNCKKECKDYPFYGLQSGDECWCGDYTSSYDRNGRATNCDEPCAGNSNVNCGGHFAMRTFTQAKTDSAATTCVTDKGGDDRIFTDVLESSDMTPAACRAHCKGRGKPNYGTQYGRECWCGDAGVDHTMHGSSSECTRPCSGDPTKFCGGKYAMTVYIEDDTPAVPAVAPTPATGSSVPSPDYPMPTPAPTTVMTIPTSCTGAKSNIRWASGTGSKGRMYLEDGGCGTMTDLYKSRVEKDGWTAKGPIYVLDENDDIVITPTKFTGKWLLTSELHVLRGSIFYCRGNGSKDGSGDCDELRIQSTGPDDFHEVRGHGGSLYFENTIVTSWDPEAKKPQEEYKDGRSFLNCVSEYESSETCEGQPKNNFGECRMDIINSEMGYMGWFDSESYGLTWKVRGFCKNKSNPDVFDKTNVYGDIIDSDIHHMYYGMYSYGHQGGVWTNNKMHDNHQYGFDPHDDSDYLTIARNKVYNNVNHGIIASKRCNHVEIYDNEVYNGGADAAGIFLHRSSDSAKVYDNNIHDMQDAGIAILESFDADIHDNSITNVQYGIRISLGGGNNKVYDNKFDTCSDYGLFTYMGTDPPEKTDDGRPGENQFYNNVISNTDVGVKLKEADNTVITGNTFTGTKELEFFNARETTWDKNALPSGVCLDNISSDKGVAIPTSTFRASSGLPAKAC